MGSMRPLLVAVSLTVGLAHSAGAQAPGQFARPELLVDAAWLAANASATYSLLSSPSSRASRIAFSPAARPSLHHR